MLTSQQRMAFRSKSPCSGVRAFRGSRTASVVPQAKYKGELVDKVTIRDDGKASGFRFDPSMQRWLRDARADSVVDVTVRPLAGQEYVVWPVIHYQLMEKKLLGVSPEEAAKMAKKGWTLVDTRLPGDFENIHAAGAVNAPIFRIVEGTKLWDQVKKIVMAGLAMAPTERDPEFVSKALGVVKKNQKIIVMCAIGGTLDTKLRLRPDKKPNGTNDPERNFGRESRSLKACHELLYKGGWSANNIRFLEGGFQQWKYQGFPVESSYDK